ncbi:MAG: acyl carrier protein [Lachnospiraceae bacterium]|nr:acyl carrier protein [Lachnospiraceae bacterium]
MNEKFKEQFVELVSQYCDLEPEEITMDMKFREDLGFNSLNFMTFLGDIEDNFDIEVDEEKVLELTTVQDALEYAAELTEEG